MCGVVSLCEGQLFELLGLGGAFFGDGLGQSVVHLARKYRFGTVVVDCVALAERRSRPFFVHDQVLAVTLLLLLVFTRLFLFSELRTLFIFAHAFLHFSLL